MPRAKKAPASTEQAVVPTTALVASAHRYTGSVPRIYAPSKDWQSRAYHHYGICGEARFAARYFGHAISRATLYYADEDGKKNDEAAGAVLLKELFAGPEGQSGMLEAIGVHLTVAGECYLIGREINGADIWEVLSIMEVQSGAGGWSILGMDGAAWEPLEDADVVIRIWLPRPDRRWEADSPFRSLLPVLDEIERISAMIHSQTISALTGNGLLLVPDQITFPPAPEVDGKVVETANDAEAFMNMLGSLMAEALKRNGSAAEQVPGVVMADAEALDKIQHLTFWTPLDEHAQEMRRANIHRFALGMDLPPELVLGMGSNEGTGGGSSNGVSHWGAWMIEEQAIKMHIEPMLDVICNAVLASYVRPLTPSETGRVMSDTSALRLRPDRSAESLELYDRGLVSPKTVVLENGFKPDEMMNDEERKEWLLIKTATGSNTPEQVEAAQRELGVDLDVRYAEADTVEAPEPEVREAPSDPSLEDHPTRPRTPEYGVYEVLVLRGLERIGNRLRNTTQTKTPGSAFDAHVHISANGSVNKVMEDAWGLAEVVLPDKDRAHVIATLDAYCRDLLAQSKPFCREDLYEHCREAGL